MGRTPTELAVAIAFAPLNFAFDVWAFGFWRTVRNTRVVMRVEDWFWDNFGGQPNGPPPKGATGHDIHPPPV